MRENDLLENAPALAGEKDSAAAYRYLAEKRRDVPDCGPQVWYVLACLAGGGGAPETALAHLTEAISERGFFYRPEVLEDEDLLALMGDPAFTALRALSDDRYAAALKEGKSRCTWRGKTGDEIVLCLHGNGQNGEIALSDWAFLNAPGVQVEALQSAVPDCTGRYRWGYDGAHDGDLYGWTRRMDWGAYTRRTLAGFSAGCDGILRELALTPVSCQRILLQSPWTPFFTEEPDRVAEAVARRGAKAFISCGELDEDCRDTAAALYEKLRPLGAELCWQPGIRHQFPKPSGT